MPRAPFTIAELSKETRRASDDRENTTARLFVTIVNSAKGRRERESRGGAAIDDSTLEPLNRATSDSGEITDG